MAIKLQTPRGVALLWRSSWSCPENHDLQGQLSAHFAGMTTLDGAAARWPRRPAEFAAVGSAAAMLQWGRGTMAAETTATG